MEGREAHFGSQNGVPKQHILAPPPAESGGARLTFGKFTCQEPATQ